MRINKFCRCSAPFAFSLLVIACGGEGIGVVTNNTDTDQATVDLGAANASAPAFSVTGRVADGYIRGATVCVDINENDACDLDEPFAITVDGGAYDLAVPDEHSDKPIVAAIPAEAIDEDTGEPVGLPMVFIAPADRPEFLSPITTLVHQEQRANPALNSDEAEQAVKNMLGIDESNVSLFTDYVAQSDPSENKDGTAERFNYLHDTARVVASMMKDIETQVENAAVSRGVDVAGDSDTRRAIQDIVRNEVRELLPQIARQVAEIVGNTQSTSAAGASSQVAEFDPQALALLLRPEVEAADVTGRIEANIHRVDAIESDLRSLLSDGVYWMEFDCHYDGSEEEMNTSHSNDVDTDNGLTDLSAIRMPECEAMYGRVQLSDDGSELASEQYVLNVDSGTWESSVDEDDNRYANYSLVGDEWTIVSSNGPDGSIEFLTNNSAVVTNEEGSMNLKSVTQTLDGSPVIHHLLEDGADSMWFDLVERENIFPSESEAYRISVRQSYHPYVMFNFPAHNADDNNCADYNDNCNVVDIVNAATVNTAQSLDQLRESMIEGVSLRSHSRFDGRALMRFAAAARDDGQLPTEGRVAWIRDGEDHTINYPSTVDIEDIDVGLPAAGEPESSEFSTHEECVAVLTEAAENADVDDSEPLDMFAQGEFAGTREELAALIAEGSDPVEGDFDALSTVNGFDELFGEVPAGADVDKTCSLIMSQTGVVANSQNDESVVSGIVSTDSEVVDSANSSGTMLNSRWKMIEVNGVEMIEIHLPMMLRNESDGVSEEALLLIEHDNFVRAGVRLPDTRFDRVFTYNENAFVTLRSIVETGMGNTQ